jgi:ribosome-binding factor A
MSTQRQIQMARRLAEEISRILLREVDDPRVRLVTITDVELSPDLKHARVFFSAIGGPPSDTAEALQGLRRARRFIRRCLAEQAELRFTPTLEFRYDPTAERAQKVETILRQIAEERGTGPEGPSEEAEGADFQSADHDDGDTSDQDDL